jgi:hypothetical protein
VPERLIVTDGLKKIAEFPYFTGIPLPLALQPTSPIMKKLLVFSTLILGILCTSACKKQPPVAQFSMDKTVFKMSESIKFTNQSENADTYAWDFGDNKKSTSESPSHTFASAGDFTIKLTATGPAGTDSISKTISVSQNLTGIWRKTLNFGFQFGVNGTMNLTQNDDNTLSGSYVYEDGMGSFTLKPTSNINGNSVLIEWNEAPYKFQGTVNTAGTGMNGQISMDGQNGGTWSAIRL